MEAWALPLRDGVVEEDAAGAPATTATPIAENLLPAFLSEISPKAAGQ